MNTTAVLKPFFLFMHVVFLLGLHYVPPLVSGFVQRGNETDRVALRAFKAGITSDPFGALNSWNESTHFCQWAGVTCGRRHQRVTVLRLDNQKLGGSLSPHVGNLSFLRVLWLRNISLSDAIPPELGRLRRLQIMSLVNNTMTGGIPVGIIGCSNLLHLDLSGNRLTGEIPPELGSLTLLKWLYIGDNNLTGGVPSTIGNLSSLTILYASNNLIGGNIPDALGQLKKLEVLSLELNNLVGTIPSSIFNISFIFYFNVNSNQIHGSLPSELGNTLPNLREIEVDFNFFTGSIPISLSNATELNYFGAGSNKLTGKVPPLDKLNSLEVLALHSNHLGIGEADDLSFLDSLINATFLYELDLSSNNFGGMLPESIGNFSSDLYALSFFSNNIVGNIPNGIGNIVNLQILEVSINHLSGNIPANIGKLQKLRTLILEDNRLQGEIPSSFANLTSLLHLYVSANNLCGSIPSQIGKYQFLLELKLDHNYLNGIIPKEVGKLSSLLNLNLAYNNLSGSLPLEIGLLQNIEILDVSANMLVGNIPSSLGSCVMLTLLNMEGNKLWGIIPSTFGNLRGIEELDLSPNNLSGKIPEYFASFIFLKKLNLSFNDFEGAVPERGVFKNRTAFSIEGNNKLCGGIQELQLHSCNSKRSGHKGCSLTMKIIISISSAGFLGLLLLLCFLYLCRLRQKTNVSSFKFLGNSFQQVSYQSLLKATDGFSSANLIGVGSFGSVFKGVLDEGGKVVAVKVLNLQFRGASKSFIAECKALKNIKHRNLVKIFTACSTIDYQGNDFKALVYEFMVNGTLQEWLHPNDNSNDAREESRTLNFIQRLNIAVDVASALDYLHHYCSETIVHCDLKPTNILLDDEMTARVGDFGLARFLLEAPPSSSVNQSSSFGLKGSIGYIAPEYGTGNEVSTSGDVYSYGILVLEMFTGKRPTDSMFTDGLTLCNFAKMSLPEPMESIFYPTLLPQGKIGEANTSISRVDTQSSLSRNKIRECLISLLQVGIACSEEQLTDRPDMNEVVTQLHKIKNTLLGTGVRGDRRSRIAV